MPPAVVRLSEGRFVGAARAADLSALDALVDRYGAHRVEWVVHEPRAARPALDGPAYGVNFTVRTSPSRIA